MTPLRILALGTAAVTALLLVVGSHDAEFVAADLVVVALLVAGALVPNPRWAVPALLAGFAFALGVYVVAFGATVAEEEPSYALVAGVLTCLVAAALAVRRLAATPAPIAG